MPESDIYIGCKVIKARKCSYGEYCTTKKQEKSKGSENMGDGYMIMYPDGYISWCPQDVFEKFYRKVSREEVNFFF